MILIALCITVVISINGCSGDSLTSYPKEKDGDGDGLWDSAELEIGTDLQNADTDGDGMNDYDEITRGRDPLGMDESDDPAADQLQPYGKSVYRISR